MPELPPYHHALTQVLQALVPCTAVEQPMPVSKAAGHILAEPIQADRDIPPFHRAAMDGYAVCTSTWQSSMPVHTCLQAGHQLHAGVPADACIEIATGAAVPPPFDAVIPYEQTDRQNPVTFHLDDVPASGANIHPQAADAASGATIVKAGTMLRAAEIGLAAMVGVQNVVVYAPPRVHVVTSGDEVVEDDLQPSSHQIRNSNRPMIAELIHRCGGRVTSTDHVIDTPTSGGLTSQESDADLLVTTGGISAGRADHVATTLTAAGCHWLVTGVAMQPGKPVRIGVLDQKVIVCLPGNPVSALVCGALLLAPILRQWLHQPATPYWHTVTLQQSVPGNPRRTAFRPACRTNNNEVLIPPWQGSGDLVHAAGTDGVVELPQTKLVEAGTQLRMTTWP